MQVEPLADLLDEQAEVVLKGQASEQLIAAGLGAILGDAIDDEIEGIAFSGVEDVQKLLRAGKLDSAHILRREGQLPGKLAIEASRNFGIILIIHRLWKMVKLNLAACATAAKPVGRTL